MAETEEVSGLSFLVRSDEAGPYLVGGKCASCDAVFFPKQSICPRCTGQNIGEVALSRVGRLHTYTEVHQKPPDYNGPVPYLIGRVQLPEGVFVLAQLKARKEDLRIGMQMEVLLDTICQDEGGIEFIGYRFQATRSRSAVVKR